jgi:hypothetical protein
MCTTLGRFSRDGDFNRWRGLYTEEVQPQDALSIKFSKTCHYRVTSTLARQQQFRGCASNQNLSREDVWTAVATTSSRPPSSRDVSVGALGGSADPARTSTERATPTTPPGGMIDLMRQGNIVGSVGPLHGPGRQRSRASAGQPDRPEGEDQLGPTTSQLGPIWILATYYVVGHLRYRRSVTTTS